MPEAGAAELLELHATSTIKGVDLERAVHEGFTRALDMTEGGALVLVPSFDVSTPATGIELNALAEEERQKVEGNALDRLRSTIPQSKGKEAVNEDTESAKQQVTRLLLHIQTITQGTDVQFSALLRDDANELTLRATSASLGQTTTAMLRADAGNFDRAWIGEFLQRIIGGTIEALGREYILLRMGFSSEVPSSSA